MTAQTQVLYDGQCALCQRSVEALAARDARRRLRFVDLHSVDVTAIHPSLTPQACREEMHVVTPAGRVLKGFHAFRHLWGRLPVTAWLAPLLCIPGVSIIGSLVYRWIARRRHDLSHRCASGRCTHPWHSGQHRCL